MQKFDGDEALEEHKKVRLEDKKKTRRNNPLRRKAAEKLKAGTSLGRAFCHSGPLVHNTHRIAGKASGLGNIHTSCRMARVKMMERAFKLINRRNGRTGRKEATTSNARRVSSPEQCLVRPKPARGNDSRRLARSVRSVRIDLSSFLANVSACWILDIPELGLFDF